MPSGVYVTPMLLNNRHEYSLHWTEEETEARRGCTACPRSHSKGRSCDAAHCATEAYGCHGRTPGGAGEAAQPTRSLLQTACSVIRATASLTLKTLQQVLGPLGLGFRPHHLPTCLPARAAGTKSPPDGRSWTCQGLGARIPHSSWHSHAQPRRPAPLPPSCLALLCLSAFAHPLLRPLITSHASSCSLHASLLLVLTSV